MAGYFQDDNREKAMRTLFGLYKDKDEGRSGIDAHLELDGQMLPFELKTTSQGSVTTVRDFGPDHIEKWRDKHWLIGFFIGGEQYYKYASPADMAPWIQGKADYIRADFTLAEIASNKLQLTDLYQVLPPKPLYSLEDAQYLQKRQYSKAQYLEYMDQPGGYSPQRMLEILQDRARYLVSRGSTLNNPHIPFAYFANLPAITRDHALQLREQVCAYLSRNT